MIIIQRLAKRNWRKWNMSDYNDTPFSKSEMLERFKIDEIGYGVTGFVREVSLADTNSGATYTGRLYWDTHDGYSMMWDEDVAPDGWERPEFEYLLDSILEVQKNA
jgi:hypothetical protein